MPRTEKCLCGALDCPHCFPENFDMRGRYIGDGTPDPKAMVLEDEDREIANHESDLDYDDVPYPDDVYDS